MHVIPLYRDSNNRKRCRLQHRNTLCLHLIVHPLRSSDRLWQGRDLHQRNLLLLGVERNIYNGNKASRACKIDSAVGRLLISAELRNKNKGVFSLKLLQFFVVGETPLQLTYLEVCHYNSSSPPSMPLYPAAAYKGPASDMYSTGMHTGAYGCQVCLLHQTDPPADTSPRSRRCASDLRSRGCSPQRHAAPEILGSDRLEPSCPPNAFPRMPARLSRGREFPRVR